MKSFLSFDNQSIYYMEKGNVAHSKAVLFIIHGMAEHILRYESFAKTLNDKDLFVVGMDLRGHGQTGKENGTLGHFEDEDWFHIISDLLFLYQLEKERFPDLPFFIMGHSMGSFLVRYTIQYYPALFQGAIIMGTGSPEQKWDMILARRLLALLPSKKEARFIHSLVFGGFQKKIEQPKTKCDWIRSDPMAVEEYIHDPYCGFVPTNGFYKSFFQGLKALSNIEKEMKWNQDFPMLLLSGAEDPVGDKKNNVIEYYNILAAKGARDLTLTFYEGQRHDILHDKKREDVIKDIMNWLLDKI